MEGKSPETAAKSIVETVQQLVIRTKTEDGVSSCQTRNHGKSPLDRLCHLSVSN